jgi:hypothetical protein
LKAVVGSPTVGLVTVQDKGTTVHVSIATPGDGEIKTFLTLEDAKSLHDGLREAIRQAGIKKYGRKQT